MKNYPHRFELTESGNGTTPQQLDLIPPVSSNLMTRIYVDSNTPIIDNVPMTISIRSQVLAIEGIDIDETRITDTGQQDILSILMDGQSLDDCIKIVVYRIRNGRLGNCNPR